MKEYPKIKGLVYEIEEYFYEIKLTKVEDSPERIVFLVEKYEEHLNSIIKLSRNIIKKYKRLEERKKPFPEKCNPEYKNKIKEIKKIHEKYLNISDRLEKIIKDYEDRLDDESGVI